MISGPIFAAAKVRRPSSSFILNCRKICDSWKHITFANCRRFCDNCRRTIVMRRLCVRQVGKFLIQRIGDMLAYRLYIASKQLRHLMTIQPHRLVFKTNIEPNGFVRLIDDYLVLVCVHLHLSLHDNIIPYFPLARFSSPRLRRLAVLAAFLYRHSYYSTSGCLVTCHELVKREKYRLEVVTADNFALPLASTRPSASFSSLHIFAAFRCRLAD